MNTKFTKLETQMTTNMATMQMELKSEVREIKFKFKSRKSQVQLIFGRTSAISRYNIML